MKNPAPESTAPRRLAAFLLPTLPSVVALASYAHGHGSLSGQGLGMVVVLAIAAAAVVALRLLVVPSRRSSGELAPVARLFNGYGA